MKREKETWHLKGVHIILLISTLVPVLIGCVTYRLAPDVLDERQKVIYVEGYEAIIDECPLGENNGLTVSVFGHPTDDVIALHVFFGNETDQLIDVLPDTIILEGLSDQGEKQIKVWDANEYIRKVKRIQNTALVLQAIGLNQIHQSCEEAHHD